jgi:excinuclease ABC subunit A
MKSSEQLDILGAKVHNLQNIDLSIPRDQLVVITGLSGSGKSSLAFDTLYAEGQRRYMETFSAYARQFIGNMEHPDVDKITGLSPVISIEQKTVSKNPRSTVGTITEIYDFLRLLFARVSNAYSYNTGELMRKYSDLEILETILETYNQKNITVLAPLVRARKGHYRELFEYVRKQGFVKVRVDGVIKELVPRMQTDRYKIHDIEVVIDKLFVEQSSKLRLTNTLKTAFKVGKGSLAVLEDGSDQLRNFSKFLMCPSTGISYAEPEPNHFSFNSPYGACPHCNGLGYVQIMDRKKMIPNDS